MRAAELLAESKSYVSWMWLINPVTDQLLFRKRSSAVGTHAEWMEKLGLVPQGFTVHLMDFPEDRDYESKFDRIVRGVIDVATAKKTIYFEQHSSLWKPYTNQIKGQFLRKHPELSGYNWVNLTFKTK